MLLKKNRYCNVVVDNKLQIVISTIFIMATIFMDQFILNAAKMYIQRVQILVMSIGTCILGVLLELSNMSSKNMELEKDIVARLRAEEKEKFSYDKAVIDMLNIKAHDLKHQLAVSCDMLNTEATKEIAEAVNSYENMFFTGNSALDAILARKNHIAEKSGITVNCFTDAESLSFMCDVDVYSLFGNILDNAIEAAEKVENPAKKVINISITVKEYFVSINVTNYFEGALEFEGELPHTTKTDRLNHGFGMASIKTIVEKYSGDLNLSIDGDIFVLDILFPL